MSKYQTFQMQTVNRSQLKRADYNPRWIDEENRKKLKKGIKKHGLVEPLIWNKRTGNLVSGHQRLSILDELEKSDNYELEVAVVDISEEEEKQLNVQLNNTSMQGDFDLDMLGDLLAEGGGAFEDFGFSEFDIEMMSGANDRFEDFLPDAPAVKAAKDELKEIKNLRKEMKEGWAEEQNAEFFFVVICKDAEERAEIFRDMGVHASERYVTVDQLRRIKKKTIS